MIEFFQTNLAASKWVVFISLILFIGTLVVVPYLITRIPDDYFNHDQRETTHFADHYPVIRLLLLLVKNLVGYILVLLGIVMLVLPGQGILTIITGLILVDFPNKYQMERWLVSLPRVLKTMNWFRRRAGKKPLVI